MYEGILIRRLESVKIDGVQDAKMQNRSQEVTGSKGWIIKKVIG